MSKKDIIRAWKDPEFRAGLNAKDRGRIPEHPAGMIELDADELTKVAGGGFRLAAGVPALSPGGGLTQSGNTCDPLCTIDCPASTLLRCDRIAAG